MTGRYRGADAVVQSLIYLQSMEMRVRLTRCRSYVVLVRRVPSSLLFWPSPTLAWLAGVCSPRTAPHRLATRSFLLETAYCRSQHGILLPHLSGQRVPLPCTQHLSLPTQQFSLFLPFTPFAPSPQASTRPFLDPRPLRSNHLQHKPLARDRCTHTSSNLTSPPRRYPLSPPTPTPTPALHRPTP